MNSYLYSLKSIQKILALIILVLPSLSLASPDWMKEIPDDKKISEFTILGTHNTCALHGGDYAACQSLDLKQQLDLGVRFLDIRCRVEKDDFHITHGIADQKSLFTEVVAICQKFLKEHPSEAILISIKQEASKGLKAGDVGRIFQRISGKNKKLWYLKNEMPLLKQARGKLVVITRDREIRGIPWRAFSIQDAFWISRKNTLENKWQKITKHFEKTKSPILNYASCTGVLNPPNYTAKIINKKLIDYAKTNPTKIKGIIVVDFVTKELAERMIPSLSPTSNAEE